uniref:polysaccharide biosynthesis protein n=1 Tax=Bacillus sp. WP8 TaxID=756828 RepID=UPI0021B25328
MFAREGIVVVGHGEFRIDCILVEVKELYGERMRVYGEIGDIEDKEKMSEMVGEFEGDMIYDGGGDKDVGVMEISRKEGVKKNIMGRKNVAEA